jgi:putative phosphoesterase
MRIGIVGDTHVPDRAARIPPAAVDALRGVDLILHAGDISTPAVLDELRCLAPVLAVRGNNAGDRHNFDPPLPRRIVVRAGGYRIGMTHGVQNYSQRLRDFAVGKLGYKHLLVRPVGWRARRQFDAVDAIVFGHIHWPWIGTLDGVLMVNPGGLCGRRDRSLAFVNAGPNGLHAQLVYIDPPRQPRGLWPFHRSGAVEAVVGSTTRS